MKAAPVFDPSLNLPCLVCSGCQRNGRDVLDFARFREQGIEILGAPSPCRRLADYAVAMARVQERSERLARA